MTPTATGRLEARDGNDWVVFDRTFRAPIESVWAAITEPDRLERWIGTWAGDPASGSVLFRMTAESEDASAEAVRIDDCDPPRRLAVTTNVETESDSWHLVLELVEHAGRTTLSFSQSELNAETAANVGPGWEYYLDRLVAAETEQDVAGVNWDDYYPAQSDYYRALFT